MATFKVICDFVSPGRAGVSGMYQIEKLYKNGKDVTSRIDPGRMFHEEDEEDEELTAYLSEIFGIPVQDIHYESTTNKNHPGWPFKD